MFKLSSCHSRHSKLNMTFRTPCCGDRCCVVTAFFLSAAQLDVIVGRSRCDEAFLFRNPLLTCERPLTFDERSWYLQTGNCLHLQLDAARTGHQRSLCNSGGQIIKPQLMYDKQLRYSQTGNYLNSALNVSEDWTLVRTAPSQRNL